MHPVLFNSQWLERVMLILPRLSKSVTKIDLNINPKIIISPKSPSSTYLNFMFFWTGLLLDIHPPSKQGMKGIAVFGNLISLCLDLVEDTRYAPIDHRHLPIALFRTGTT